MPSNTSRLGLVQPLISDSASELRLAIAANATALDSAVRYFSGTISNRGTVVPSPIDGDEYRATDTGLVYKYNGTAWGTLIVAGAWSALTLGTGVTDGGSYTPSGRLEGDTVRLKGSLVGTSITSWATLPIALRPATTVGLAASLGALGSPQSVRISSAGVLTSQSAVNGLFLDGLTFSIS